MFAFVEIVQPSDISSFVVQHFYRNSDFSIGQVYDINIKKSLKLLVPRVYAQYEVGLLVCKYGNIFFAGQTRLFQARSKLVGMPVCPHRLSKCFPKNSAACTARSHFAITDQNPSPHKQPHRGKNIIFMALNKKDRFNTNACICFG